MDMSTTADSGTMESPEERGLHIKDRRELFRMSQLGLANLAGYDSDDTVRRAENGDGSEVSLKRIEAALNQWEAEQHADPNATEHTATLKDVRIEGITIGEVTVSTNSPEALGEDMANVIRALRESGYDPTS